MLRIINLLSALILTLLLATAPLAANASENAMRETFMDALYGGAAGSLLGAAVLAFTKKPANHLEYIGYGTAVGVVGGTVYGVTRSVRALAEIENGTVKLAVPTVMPDISENPATKQTNISWRANLLSGTFN